jgi:hypothetical protein
VPGRLGQALVAIAAAQVRVSLDKTIVWAIG